jgi:hypothetical protein
MHLVQLLLPLFDNESQPIPRAHFERVASELTEHFGGLTAFTRAPAEGLWREGGDGTTRDEIVVYEVMTDALDEEWWRSYRTQIEERFAQERIVVRAQSINVL